MQGHLTAKDMQLQQTEAAMSRMRNDLLQHRDHDVRIHVPSPDFSLSSHTASTATPRNDVDNDSKIFMLQSELKLYRDGMAFHKKFRERVRMNLQALQTDVDLAMSKIKHSVFSMYRSLKTLPSSKAVDWVMMDKTFEKLQILATTRNMDKSSGEGENLFCAMAVMVELVDCNIALIDPPPQSLPRSMNLLESSHLNELEELRSSVDHLTAVIEWTERVTALTEEALLRRHVSPETPSPALSVALDNRRGDRRPDSDSQYSRQVEVAVDKAISDRLGLLEEFMRKSEKGRSRQESGGKHEVTHSSSRSVEESSGSDVESNESPSRKYSKRRDDAHRHYSDTDTTRIRRGRRGSSSESSPGCRGVMRAGPNQSPTSRQSHVSRSHHLSGTTQWTKSDTCPPHRPQRHVSPRRRGNKCLSPATTSRQAPYPGKDMQGSEYDRNDDRGLRSESASRRRYSSASSTKKLSSTGHRQQQRQSTSGHDGRNQPPFSNVRTPQHMRSSHPEPDIESSYDTGPLEERRDEAIRYQTTRRKNFDSVGTRLSRGMTTSRLFTPSGMLITRYIMQCISCLY